MSSGIVFMDAEAVRSALSYRDCIPLMRKAMTALSSGEVVQSLRTFLPVGEHGTFAMMPAVTPQGFGAKLVSVYPDPENQGSRRHQGLVILFDRHSGAPVFVGDAEEITRIRTAAASAAATDALARKDAEILTVIGTGAQAKAHILAITAVRDIKQVRLWGRNADKAREIASVVTAGCQIEALACPSLEQACDGADIVCTTTAAREPFLSAAHIGAGCHVNLVGSSGPATAEALPDLVAKAQFFGDHREHVLLHGGDFLRAKADGLIHDNHFIAEIGEVHAERHPGRTDNQAVTIYKSLGHATQDLACAAWLLAQNR